MGTLGTSKTGALKRVLAMAAGTSALALGMAAPAGAQPGTYPCELALSFLCQIIPVAPDLEESIDLTQQPGTIAGVPVPQMPAAPETDYGPPADFCANGCI